MFGQILKIILVAIAINWIKNIVITLDLLKVIYNHAPGPCHLIKEIEHGSEDIEILPNGLAFISYGLKYIEGYSNFKSGIYLIDLNNFKGKAIDLKFLGDFNSENLNPHGLSSWTDKSTGVVSLYVVNHSPKGEHVEVFDFNSKQNALVHRRTIKDENIYAINNLVAVDLDSFYYTNDRYFSTYNPLLTIILIHVPLGNIGYYNGKKAVIIESGFTMPNGINISPDKKYLYVATFASKKLNSFDIKMDKTLLLKESIPLYSSPDNINVDPVTGDLWIGFHPILYKIYQHLFWDIHSLTPSQVLRISMKDGKVKSIVEVYANDGSELSMSSVAGYYKNNLLVGTVDHKLLYCNVKSLSN